MDGGDARPIKRLRDYQQNALDKINERYAAGICRQLLSAATGAGKTEIFSFLIKDKLKAGENALVLAHRDRLTLQAASRIEGIVGENAVGLVNGSSKHWWMPCVSATVQTAAQARQLNRAPKFKTIIIDEAHRAGAKSYAKVVDELLEPGGLLLGVTATPNRTDKKTLIPSVFEELVFEIGMQQLIDEGHLCPVIGKEIRMPIDFSAMKTAMSTDGIKDYKSEDINAAFEAANWLERLTAGWKEVAADRRTIVFVPPGIVDGRSCGMAHSLAAYMSQRGINAAAVDGATAQGEQDRVINSFTKGDIQVLVNVNIFTEGLDIPPIDCVLFARPTQSSIIYSQSIGRGTRKCEGKENCLVIDVTGITNQLARDGQSLMSLGKVLPPKPPVPPTGPPLIPRGGGEKREINNSLLTSSQLEIRDLDFRLPDMKWNWHVDPDSKRAVLVNGKTRYEIWRDDDPGSPYYYRADNGRNVFEGNQSTYKQAKELLEHQAKIDELKKRAILHDPNARWRSEPVSDAQKRLANKMFVYLPDGCTKGQAKDLIDAKMSKRRR